MAKDIITIDIYEARRLENKSGTVGKSDAFVELILGEEKLRTEIQHNARCAATWDETFKFRVNGIETVTISAYDYDRCFRDNLIGQTTLPITERIDEDQWYDITTSSGKVTGQIRLAMYFDQDI
ncbi:hypothetical protein DSO57_1019212 [Entomophthora muscae]|uniref:Uncharacterized protein n=2 Tax=Entomophthora muscae TaxID=34485 RepID=A0ACC2U2E3_9FUNG|nr:hypothetical protein DSO57_1023087 [Entomophthora muscae]KAJ9080984.1 hypothetical protein DSO57_1019212 [Entomophthora muscae]